MFPETDDNANDHFLPERTLTLYPKNPCPILTIGFTFEFSAASLMIDLNTNPSA